MTREELLRLVTSQVTKARTGQTRQDDEALALKIIQFVTEACAEIIVEAATTYVVDLNDGHAAKVLRDTADDIRKLGSP